MTRDKSLAGPWAQVKLFSFKSQLEGHRLKTMNDSDLYSERSPLLTETNDEETKDASSSSVDESTKESDSRSCSRKHNSLFSCRNVLALYLYAAFALVYAMRANLSVAIVTMVNQTFAEGSSLKINPESECHPAHNVSLDEVSGIGQFQ